MRLTLLLLAALQGCTVPAIIGGTCAFKPVGQDEHGITYFHYHCEQKE